MIAINTFFNKGYASIICNTSEDDKIEKQCDISKCGGFINGMQY